MADGRKTNGGHKSAGRKPKAVEQKLIEKLSPLDESAFKMLKRNIDKGEKWAIELFFKYKYGMPKQSIEQTNVNYNQDLTEDDIKLISKALHEKY